MGCYKMNRREFIVTCIAASVCPDVGQMLADTPLTCLTVHTAGIGASTFTLPYIIAGMYERDGELVVYSNNGAYTIFDSSSSPTFSSLSLNT